MTIRTRLLITNILMIVIPLALIGLSLSFTALSPGFMNPEPLPQLMDAIRLVNNVGDLQDEETYSSLATDLEGLGFRLLIQEGTLVLYTNLAQGELARTLQVLEASGPSTDILLFHDQYTIYQQDFPQEQIQITAVNFSIETKGLVQRLSGFNRKITNWPLTALSLIIIAVTNSLLAWVITRSIMKPLRRLSGFAQEIRDGNLDFPVEYPSKDEFSHVFADFEEMRARLKSSVDLQQQYEENRKELLAGISHDLSTPLTSIKGYVSGLMDGIADTPVRQEKYLQTIYNTASAMDKLVEELFLLSKLDLNRVPFYLENVDLVGYFEDCQEELRLELDKNQLSLELVMETPGPIMAAIDPNQFFRVIRNIIDNSAKYKAGPSGRIEIVLRAQDKIAQIIIKDDGQGVTQSEADKIFASFYRGDPARQSGRGSGLGLAIARRIVEQLKGSIQASSSPGTGLTIIIHLPRLEEVRNPEPDSDNRR